MTTMTSDDAALLRQYVTEGSEAAFGELVRRHVDLVHSAALRQVGGDCHRAQDVTQAVFCELARNAPRLVSHRALSGWLYTTARFIGARQQRSEVRRSARERTSHRMIEMLNEPTAESVWREIGPVLDKAMEALPERDRTGIVLRFFENKPWAEVGAALGLSENAARMRVERGMAKLREWLARQGVRSPSSVLGTALLAHAVSPAPVGLASTLVGPALASAAMGVATVPGMTLGLFHMMNTTKIAIGVSAVAMVAVVGTYVGMNKTNGRLRAEIAALRARPVSNFVEPVRSASETYVDAEELARLRAEHGELQRLRGEIGVLRRERVELAQLLAGQAEHERQRAATTEAAKRRQAIEDLAGVKMNFTVPWARAFQSFARENHGEIPATFEQATPYILADDQAVAAAFPSHDFEIVFQGSLESIKEPARTIILREKEPFHVQPSGEAWRTYLFADGHSEVHIAADGNFEPWEQSRLATAVQSIAD